MHWIIYIYIYIYINYNYSNNRQRWSDCVHIIIYIYICIFYKYLWNYILQHNNKIFAIIKACVPAYYNLIDKKCKDLSIDMSANTLLYNLYLSCSYKHFKDFKIFILKFNILYKKDNFIYIILLNVSVNLR